jgi:hypothetical protein
MTKWPDQITEFQRNWVQQQQQLLNGWLDSMRSGGSDSLRATWRKASDVMEQQVNSALDAQRRSLLAFTENMANAEGAPEGFNQAAKQMEEGIERWAEVQRDMWKVWFDTLRDSAPEPQTPGEVLMKNWEDMVKRTTSIQEEWLSALTSAQGKSAGASKKGSTKSSGSGDA